MKIQSVIPPWIGDPIPEPVTPLPGPVLTPPVPKR